MPKYIIIMPAAKWRSDRRSGEMEKCIQRRRKIRASAPSSPSASIIARKPNIDNDRRLMAAKHRRIVVKFHPVPISINNNLARLQAKSRPIGEERISPKVLSGGISLSSEWLSKADEAQGNLAIIVREASSYRRLSGGRQNETSGAAPVGIPPASKSLTSCYSHYNSVCR